MSQPGREQVRELRITVSGNTGIGATAPVWAIARWIRVVPIAESDSYDVTIKDGSGYIMMKRTSQLGTFAEQLQLSMGIVKTVLIENATQDGTYVFLADLH